MARQISHRQAAANLRMSAAQYFARAMTLDNELLGRVGAPPHRRETDDKRYKSEFVVANKGPSLWEEKRAHYRLLRHLLGNELHVL